MSKLIELARQIATEAHAGQFRWDGKTPYISHPAAVAKVLEADYIDEIVAVAWLHDVVEDTDVTLDDLLDAGIPDDVAMAVRAITKRKDEPYLDYLLRLKRNSFAITVKIEDIKHNVSCLDRPRGARYDKYMLALHILEN